MFIATAIVCFWAVIVGGFGGSLLTFVATLVNIPFILWTKFNFEAENRLGVWISSLLGIAWMGAFILTWVAFTVQYGKGVIDGSSPLVNWLFWIVLFFVAHTPATFLVRGMRENERDPINPYMQAAQNVIYGLSTWWATPAWFVFTLKPEWSQAWVSWIPFGYKG